MIYLGKYKLLKNFISACDYDFLLKQIQQSIKDKRRLLVSPVASQTLAKAFFDKELETVLNNFDFLVPDSQWIKRSIRFLYKVNFKNRVYGPTLMLKVCQFSEEKGYRIFLYGNTKEVLKKLGKKLRVLFPKILIVGLMPSVFRDLEENEFKDINMQLDSIKPNIVFVCLGSPAQEIFAFSLANSRRKDNKGIVIIPVGAAFDFISGVKPQAPIWIQESGFEWLFRLAKEPGRLWKRYLVYGALFVWLVFYQKLPLLSGRKNILSKK